MMKPLFALIVSFGFCLSAEARHITLKPHKDKLFAYPEVMHSEMDGAFIEVAYDKQRDIYKRDKIPLRKAHFRYVDQSVQWSRRVRTYKSAHGVKKYFSVGKYRKGAKVTVIYLYGKGGNRRQGVNDWTFGGNFNRLQNLMNKNDGVLVTPDYTDFKDQGKRDIELLMQEFKRRSPNTVMIIACGSMGGGVCWRLAKDPDTAPLMDGMFILGSHWHDDFLSSPVMQGKLPPIPIYFGHGSWDPVFKPEIQKNFFQSILKKRPSYPARFVMFNTGKHGTPIRMVDWRRELNWMLAQH